MLRAPTPRLVLLSAFSAAVAIGLAGCGSSNKNSTATTASPPTAAPATSATTAASTSTTHAGSATTAASGSLTGTWTGSATGIYAGSFTIVWTQTGSNLSGNIMVTNPSTTLSITGTLGGNTISFGSVGGQAVTYTGTVSGNSMSGTYSVGAAGVVAGGGNWSATRSAG